MKATTLLALILGLTFSACEKDNNNSSSGTPPPASPTSSSFTLTVNGNNIMTDSVHAALHIDTIMDTIPHRIFAIAAYWGGGTHEVQAGYSDTIVSLILPVGSYYSQPLFYFDFTGATIYSSQSAQFALTSVTASAQKASGTFSGITIGDITPDTVTVNAVFSNLHYDIF